jgi:hypothetical protein
MATYNDTYRTRDGRAYFDFRFVGRGGFLAPEFWEVDILRMPSYGSRDDNLHATHRLPSSRSDCSYKVCIGNEQGVTSLTEAKRWAKAWAEETWSYIRTGERF